MQLTNRRVRLMGTVIDVSIYHEEPEPLLDQVEALLHTYNKRFSANDDSSELMKINKAAGLHSVTVHPELFELIALGKWHSCQPESHLNITNYQSQCHCSIRGKSKRFSQRKRDEN